MANYIFSLEMEVRDYECDLQGIVNNANYQHYTEHTRHEFLRAHGVSFAELHARGIDAVVARMQLQFKTPLRSFRLPDERPVLKSTVEAVCLVDGKLSDCEELNRLVP